MTRTAEVGAEAEQRACELLEHSGLETLARNYHCRYGELDLICRDRSTLVFVEVRFRKSAAFGDAAASVTRSKQRKLRATAEHFLGHNPDFSRLACRFDVVAVSGNEYRLDWIQNAFGQE